jgi:hypothetical protein
MKSCQLLKGILFIFAFTVALQINFSQNRISLESKTADAAFSCSLCNWTTAEIDKYITTGSTEQEIKKVVDRVCSLLPAFSSAQCDAFIGAYGTEIVRLLSRGVPPHNVCPALGVCNQ